MLRCSKANCAVTSTGAVICECRVVQRVGHTQEKPNPIPPLKAIRPTPNLLRRARARLEQNPEAAYRLRLMSVATEAR